MESVIKYLIAPFAIGFSTTFFVAFWAELVSYDCDKIKMLTFSPWVGLFFGFVAVGINLLIGNEECD